jgi:hypothetical protein
VKFVVLDAFKADYRRLSPADKATFRRALPALVAACDRYAADPSTVWPASLRVRKVESAPGIWEMTWSLSGPDGRATFEWVEVDGSPAVRWRRIGDHRIFGKPS